MKNILFYYIFVITYFAVLLSCVQEPTNPIKDENIQFSSKGAYILCEGLWGFDNSSLDRFDSEKNILINQYFKKVNPGYKLGDTSNDIILKGDTAFVVVSTAKTIEVFLVSTGKYIGRINLAGNRCPRHICIVNDSSAWITDLYSHSIIEFNPTTLKLTGIELKTGPAPEGIVIWNNILFVANSGYGDYLKNEPNAGTISVIDAIAKQEITRIKNITNVVDLLINYKTNTLYATYFSLLSQKDSTGGIVEINLDSYKETNRWRIDAQKTILSTTNDTMYFINKNGLYIIDFTKEIKQYELLIKNNSSDNWYSLAIDDNKLWIANSFNHQINGELLIYDLNDLTKILQKFSTGVNPNKIVFY